MTSALVLSNSMQITAHTQSTIPMMYEGHGKKGKPRPAVKLPLLFKWQAAFQFCSSESFLVNSVSCHPDLHLFAGRPPVHPCLQQWKLPSSYACLPGGRGRVQTAADARNSTWRRVHSHFSTDDMGWNKKLGGYWSATTTYFAHEKTAASKWLAKRKQDKLKKRHLAEDILPFLQTTSKATRDFKTKSLGVLVDDEAHGQITVWQKEKKKGSLQRWWERFKAQTTCNDKSKCLTPSLKTWWSNNDDLIINHLEYTL